ncbi:hypothetical protein [Ruminococcus sp. Marseille-P6503]|uniref:hypothetical protein n=1 Tax=Ruminococcus sp. Marseille-P6503 TaxID=2364796 RepID=UPI000F54256F|nr:hypothetical protein [Ruminococcus sp. Marseille-P6503]
MKTMKLTKRVTAVCAAIVMSVSTLSFGASAATKTYNGSFDGYQTTAKVTCASNYGSAYTHINAPSSTTISATITYYYYDNDGNVKSSYKSAGDHGPSTWTTTVTLPSNGKKSKSSSSSHYVERDGSGWSKSLSVNY